MRFSKENSTDFRCITAYDQRTYGALYNKTISYSVYGYKESYIISTINDIATFNLYCSIHRHCTLEVNLLERNIVGLVRISGHSPTMNVTTFKPFQVFRFIIQKPYYNLIGNYEFTFKCMTNDIVMDKVKMYRIPYIELVSLINEAARRVYNIDLIPKHVIIPNVPKYDSPAYMKMRDYREDVFEFQIGSLSQKQQWNLKYIIYQTYCIYKRFIKLFNIHSLWFNSFADHISRNIVGLLLNKPNLFLLVKRIPKLLGELCDFIIYYMNIPGSSRLRKVLLIIIILLIVIIIITMLFFIISLL